MGQDNDAIIKELGNVFKEYREQIFPRTGNIDDLIEQLSQISDIQVDLADDDGYIAGLVAAFLLRKQIEVINIRIDATLDARLEDAATALREGQEILQRVLTYRQKMLELANALSDASGIPIQIWNRGR